MLKKLNLAALFILGLTFQNFAQNSYRYTLDLNNVKDDQVQIELQAPKITSAEITYYMPKIIPGTYSNADYGKFVHQFKAYDKAGKELPVKRTTDNSWQIKNANKLNKITYQVEDTWESAVEHNVYDMAGTNIEAGKNFVINTPGFFGYFDGMKKIPFEINITKPESLYASTPLIATKTSRTNDVFTLVDADHLYDSPIMYNAPDTTSIKLGRTQVLISVYSPKKMITSAAVAGLLKDMLTATQRYLGGKLPVEKYAFIYYFNGEQEQLKRTGALEHNYSSFYALPELPFEQLAPTLFDISAHEFFHVVTPLTISSKEVKEFNFNEPVLSRHLWLYEGTTEYHSDHVQVVEGLISPEEFLQKMTEKISISRSSYNDNLSFTELSKHSADKHQDQYGNVYEKGALISACLDIYLLKLSQGKYGLRNLKHDLGIKFGKDKYFNDETLFDEIATLTFPEIREFFATYVEGNTPIPYEKFFAMAGVNMKVSKTPSLGNVQLGGTPEGNLFVAGTGNLNPLGKELGYREGDVLVKVNGDAITIQTAQQVIDKYKSTVKEGDKVEVVVKRKNESGTEEEKTLTGKAYMSEVLALEVANSPTAEQLVVRNAWMGGDGNNASAGPPVAADPKDVGEVDNVIKTLYEVISGPAGDRNWDRFKSLFYPGAYMGAVIKTPAGNKLKKFSPDEYVKMNAPHFKQYNFFEKELNRNTQSFGNIAQVFTTYEYTLELPNQTVRQRGINSVELIKEDGRWWIISLVWDEEGADQPIPAQYSGAAPEPKKKKK